MRASIIIPAYNREATIDRAIDSIARQGLSGWEIVVVDDASTDKTRDKIISWEKKYPENIIGLKFNDHLERVIATNAAIRYARGDWIIRLDSDDEMASHFIKAFEDAQQMYPKAKLFNWGSLVHWRNQDGRYHKTTVRNPFRTTIGLDGLPEPFKSGGICFGGFAFKKSLLWKSGWIPDAQSPFVFGEKMLKLHPELVKLYTLPDGRIQYDLGNPWGDDFSLFYTLTRVVAPQPLDQILHIQHVRL